MRPTISTGLYYKKDYREVLDIISETTCNNIELMLNQTFIDVSINDIEKYVQKKNLNITSIHTPLTFIAYPRKENEKYWIDRSLEYGKIFDIDTIVTHMVLFENIGLKENTLDRLHQENIINYKTEKINVCTENLPIALKNTFLSKKDEYFKFIKDNNIYTYYDTTHDGTSAFSLLNDFDSFKDNIANIHISDSKDGAEHLLLGTGDYPFEKLFTELKSMDYKGSLTVEYDFENTRRTNIADTQDAINKLQHSIEFINNLIR